MRDRKCGWSLSSAGKLAVALCLVCLLFLPALNTSGDVVTDTPFNISMSAGQSLIYQDAANGRYVNWTVLSGSWTGTGTITVNSTGGVLSVTPSSTCYIAMTTVNSFISVGGIYQTTYLYSYSSGVAQSVYWIFTIPTPPPTPTPSPSPSPTPGPIIPVYYYLYLNVSGSGSVSPSSGVYHMYTEGTAVACVATPSEGWAFDRWILGNGTEVTNPSIVLNMDRDQTALACFVEIPVEGEPTPVPTVLPTAIPTTPLFPNSIDSSYLWQYWNNGDVIGFVIACWSVDLGETFYVIVSLILVLALYIRLKNLPIMIAMWFVLGFLWIGLLPVASPIILLLFALGIASLVFYLYGLSKN